MTDTTTFDKTDSTFDVTSWSAADLAVCPVVGGGSAHRRSSVTAIAPFVPGQGTGLSAARTTGLPPRDAPR